MSTEPKAKVDNGAGEKKKMMVLVALVVVVIAVGAFQFMGGSKPAPSTTASTTDKTTPDSTTSDTKTAEGTGEGSTSTDETGTGEAGTVGTKVATNAAGEQVKELTPRDPFQVPGDVVAMNQTPVEPTPEKHTPKPSSMGGGLNPYNPTGSGPILPPGGGQLVPVSEPEPTFRVMGVLVGAHPMAVFEDDKGNQRLVALGGSVDGDTKVTKIERGRVTVVRHGKETTLVIQEEARND